jgi:hypothetical protein
MEEKAEEVKMYNIMQNAIIFTGKRGLEGYKTGGLKERWDGVMEEGDYKWIDVYYGINIYIFKCNNELYIMNVEKDEVAAWKKVD